MKTVFIFLVSTLLSASALAIPSFSCETDDLEQYSGTVTYTGQVELKGKAGTTTEGLSLNGTIATIAGNQEILAANVTENAETIGSVVARNYDVDSNQSLSHFSGALSDAAGIDPSQAIYCWEGDLIDKPKDLQ